jgi:catechol 2,3-dioxygenase-like lactoylglutathione lyase family enzyme
MPPAALSVVLLLSDDPARTASFYRDVLGLPLIEEEHGGRHPHFACQAAGLYFTIQHTGDFVASHPGTGPDSLQLCFSVPSMDAFLKHLNDTNVAPVHPARPFEHTVFVTLRDPDGRALRVMTPWVE